MVNCLMLKLVQYRYKSFMFYAIRGKLIDNHNKLIRSLNEGTGEALAHSKLTIICVRQIFFK